MSSNEEKESETEALFEEVEETSAGLQEDARRLARQEALSSAYYRYLSSGPGGSQEEQKQKEEAIVASLRREQQQGQAPSWAAYFEANQQAVAQAQQEAHRQASQQLSAQQQAQQRELAELQQLAAARRPSIGTSQVPAPTNNAMNQAQLENNPHMQAWIQHKQRVEAAAEFLKNEETIVSVAGFVFSDDLNAGGDRAIRAKFILQEAQDRVGIARENLERTQRGLPLVPLAENALGVEELLTAYATMNARGPTQGLMRQAVYPPGTAVGELHDSSERGSVAISERRNSASGMNGSAREVIEVGKTVRVDGTAQRRMSQMSNSAANSAVETSQAWGNPSKNGSMQAVETMVDPFLQQIMIPPKPSDSDNPGQDVSIPQYPRPPPEPHKVTADSFPPTGPILPQNAVPPAPNAKRKASVVPLETSKRSKQPATGAVPIAPANSETGTAATAAAAAVTATKTDELVDGVISFLLGQAPSFSQKISLTPAQMEQMKAKLLAIYNTAIASHEASQPTDPARQDSSTARDKAGQQPSRAKAGDSDPSQLAKLVQIWKGKHQAVVSENQSLRDVLKARDAHFEERLKENRRVQEKALRAYMRATVHSLQALRKDT